MQCFASNDWYNSSSFLIVLSSYYFDLVNAAKCPLSLQLQDPTPQNSQMYLISKVIHSFRKDISTSWINLIHLTFLLEKVFATELKNHQAKVKANLIRNKGRKPTAFWISLLDNFWTHSLRIVVYLKYGFTVLIHIQCLSSSVSTEITRSSCIPNIFVFLTEAIDQASPNIWIFTLVVRHFSKLSCWSDN